MLIHQRYTTEAGTCMTRTAVRAPQPMYCCCIVYTQYNNTRKALNAFVVCLVYVVDYDYDDDDGGG